MNIISKALADTTDDYLLAESEWDNGTRSDVVMEPKSLEQLRPIIIEVQSRVDDQFINRAIGYCLQPQQRYKVRPILLIICTGSIASLPSKVAEESKKLACSHNLPCCFWTAECFLISKTSLQTIETRPLNPLTALGIFLTHQSTSLTDSPHNTVTPIQHLYHLAESHYKTLLGKDEDLADEFIRLCDSHNHDFDVILDYLSDLYPVQHRLIEHIQQARERNNALKRKYGDTISFDDPDTNRTHTAPALLSGSSGTHTESTYVQRMEFVSNLKENRKKAGRRMDWQQLLREGRAIGLLNYKSVDSIRVQYKKYEKQKEKETKMNTTLETKKNK